MKDLHIDLKKAWALIKSHEHLSDSTRDHLAILAGFQSWQALLDAFESADNNNNK